MKTDAQHAKVVNALCGAVFLVVFIVVYIYGCSFKNSAGSWIKFVSVVGGGCSIILIIESLLKDYSNAKPGLTKQQLLRAVVSAGSLLAYILLFRVLGFIVSSVLFLSGFMIMGMKDKRDWKQIGIQVLIAVVFTLVFYFAFEKGLKIRLPKGIFS